MTDLATAAPVADSTTLDPGADSPSAAGGGAPTKLPEAEPSLRDSIAAAVKESAVPEDKEAPPADDVDKKPDAAKDTAKPDAEDKKAAETPAKPEAKRGDDGKFASDKPKDEPKPDAEQQKAPETDGKRHIEAPAKFLPDAKETWRNTPRAVQRDVENMAREHEAEVTRYREAAERYEPIRQYDDLIRRHGRAGAHETLQEVAQFEDLMGKNPIAAVNQLLQRVGPRKPDGSPVSLREFVQAVAQMDQTAYNRAVTPQQAQQPQNDNPRIQQLEQQLATMEQRQLATSVIEPFRAEHPRYDELKDDIALFLKSGKIPGSLSPHDRLAAAYDMAVRVNPASNVEPDPAKADPDPGSRAGESFSDSKSIKSAPGAVTPNDEPERGGSIREELERAVRRQGLR